MARAVIPATGLNLREAVTTEFRDVADLVRRSIQPIICPGNPGCYVDIEAMFADRVVVCRDGRYFSYPYAINEQNQVTFGTPIEVVETFTPVGAGAANPEMDGGDAAGGCADCTGTFVEAVGGAESGKWLIRVIQAGTSLNGVFYSDALLRESAPMFDGCRVFNKPDAEHIAGDGKSVDKLIGRLTEAKFVKGKTPDIGEVQAVFSLIEPDGAVAVKIREASARGMSDLFGFSIDANGAAKMQMREGRSVKVATSITKVNSVDLIVEPGAGGRLIRMVEALNNTGDDAMRNKLLEKIKQTNPALHASLGANATDDQIETAYREAVAVKPAGGNDVGAGSGDVTEQIRMVEARANMRSTIATCNLPQPAKDRLLADLGARERFAEADVTASIEAERTYLARFTESGHVGMSFDAGARVEDRSVKIKDMLAAFFDPAHKDHRSVPSFKEAYAEITGDRLVTGRLDHCDRSRLAESLGFREALDSTSFASVLGDSITRRMVADYNTGSVYDVWRQLANTTPVSDFRTQDRTRFGGYGDLPAVAQGDPYAALASPTDEQATYAVTKRGGTESVTLEMIKNDDVGAIRQIPIKLSRSAKRTLGKFVLDFLRTNPAIYDGKALFHVDHGNLGSAALDATSYAARRLAMLKQTEAGSLDRLGIGPANIWLPADMEAAAHDLFVRNTNLDKTFIQSLVPNIIPVWYWTDANDWCLSADKNDIPTIEIGFLDGREEPELFVQDNPSMGSMFTNDKLTWKMRHIYGGNVLDFRGLDKSVVA